MTNGYNQSTVMLKLRPWKLSRKWTRVDRTLLSIEIQHWRQKLSSNLTVFWIFYEKSNLYCLKQIESAQEKII